MEIKKLQIHQHNTSCNFCNRGVLGGNETSLIYPYEYVYRIQRETSGLLANLCEQCVRDLIEGVKNDLSIKQLPIRKQEPNELLNAYKQGFNSAFETLKSANDVIQNKNI